MANDGSKWSVRVEISHNRQEWSMIGRIVRCLFEPGQKVKLGSIFGNSHQQMYCYSLALSFPKHAVDKPSFLLIIPIINLLHLQAELAALAIHQDP